MNWRQFIRTDKRKIVIFVILFVSLFFIPFNCSSLALPTAVGVKGGYATFCRSIYQDVDNIICCVSPFGAVIDLLVRNNSIPILIIIIFSYLLSCLIVWVYDKFRKRK